MKKKREKKPEEVVSLNWRPDFRDREALPDIKTVRTSFFLSAVAVTIAIMSVMHVGFYEYTIYALGNKIEKGKAEIAARQGHHAKAIGMNNRFIDHERRIDEIFDFEDGQMIASDLILDVGNSLMPGMSLASVEFKDDKTVFQGFVVASEETDSLLKEYMERLRNVDTLKERYAEITQISVERQPGTDQIKFHLEASNPEESETPNRNGSTCRDSQKEPGDCGFRTGCLRQHDRLRTASRQEVGFRFRG